MPRVVEKVTIFVTRHSNSGHDLLLFEHPSAGIQIPAGTVEAGEKPETAARRETAEETGLDDFTAQRYLGSIDEMLPETRRIIGENTKVYARPDPSSFDWAQLRRGLVVHLERQVPGFAHVTYEEWDQVADPRYISFQITGWVPQQALAEIRRRHFFHFEHHGATPERWVVKTDNHYFTLFWVPLQALPAIVEPQTTWLSWLDLPYRLPLIKRA
jgi:8-oxo-dGTP pyrophosphatase MutT (NUDIX family)